MKKSKKATNPKDRIKQINYILRHFRSYFTFPTEWIDARRNREEKQKLLIERNNLRATL